jgi:hypothetical protein
MGFRILTILTGRNMPKIRQSREPEPSSINEKTIADFARVVEQTGILKQEGGENDGHFAGRAARFRRSPLHGTRGYLAGIA